MPKVRGIFHRRLVLRSHMLLGHRLNSDDVLVSEMEWMVLAILINQISANINFKNGSILFNKNKKRRPKISLFSCAHMLPVYILSSFSTPAK
jgi:hypothetical protein